MHDPPVPVGYIPGAQLSQRSADIKHVNSPPFPASHAVHDAEAKEDEYVPGSQAVHVLDPAELDFPSTHSRQVLEVADSTGL